MFVSIDVCACMCYELVYICTYMNAWLIARMPIITLLIFFTFCNSIIIHFLF